MKTNSSDGKKTIRGLLKKRVARTAVCLLIITLFAWMLLPVFTEAMLPVLLKKYAGINTSALDIRRISPLGIDAANFSLGPGEKPSLEADSIRLDFSPSSLMSGKFTKLSIGGGIFRCSLMNGKFIIPGLEKSQEKAQSAAPEQTASAPPKKSLLNCPGKMEIRNFILEIDVDGRIARIPVDISVKPDKTKWAFSLNARPFEKGNGIQAKGE
ncbi:MAG: hypothetical protein PHT27_06735, partial [Candidatus Izemoplasmatales bacterium]|nr:hypothetical protein [Candidatus Izemoplasmatales bacterium]